MKTVLLINSSGAHYFKRDKGAWQNIAQPEPKDKLWVVADLPEEILEAFKLPLLFGPDRSNLLERRLAAAFPNSQYRAAPIISGGLLKPKTALLAGLSSADAVASKLEKLDVTITGVWGMSMLLTLISRRLALRNAVLALRSERYLRILVVKDGIPVLTRCVRRYREDEDDEDSDANEILRTCQHLENRRIFEHAAVPPVLYLGEDSSSDASLDKTGLMLLPLPQSLSPCGDAGYLHAVFELVSSSPEGQLAPVALRARHLADKVRYFAYAGCVASLVFAVMSGQGDFRALMDLRGREQNLRAELKLATNERETLVNRISATGSDPALVRQATLFADVEMEAAPTLESIFQLAATAIADLPQVRIKSMTFRFPQQGERYCQGHTVIDLPLTNGRKIDLPLPTGSKPHDSNGNAAIPQRYAELQFVILQLENLAPEAQIEVRKRISAALKANKEIQLMQDPAAFSLIDTLKGGIGMNTTQTEKLWCMSVPWKVPQNGNLP